MKSSRVSYSLGQGNRHHMKLLEMMEGDEKEKERQPDTVRMTMMRVIKQHERWSKTSEGSTNDSTRNTAIGVGPKMAIRGSDHTEGGASAAAANMVVEETFLRLQLMHLSLASKRRSLSVEGVRAFQQFSLLSISPPSLINETPEFRVGGCRFLDPFATKNVDLIDQFPSESSDTDIDAEALAAFCFPNGLRIRIIPRCAEKGARKLGWLGKNSDGYQLQGVSAILVLRSRHPCSQFVSLSNNCG